MKKQIIFLVFLFAFIQSKAQDKSNKIISKLSKNKETVLITIDSEQPYLVGNNLYYLIIGDQIFSHSTQSKKNGKGAITFTISLSDFNRLKDNDAVWLTYGKKVRDGDSPQTTLESMFSEHVKNIWKAGKLNKAMLTQ